MGNFSKTLVRRLSGHPPKTTRPTNLPANEAQMALADGRKLWLQRVHRCDWHKLPAGTLLMLIRTNRQREPWQQATEMATVLDNQLAHPAAPSVALAWGWLPEGQADHRPSVILRLAELHVLLRYEMRASHSPDVVATINPSLN